MTSGHNNMRKVLSLLLFPVALGASAQSAGGMWLGAEADYDITSRLGAELSVGGRIEDNFDRLTRYDAGLGVTYKALRWLKVGVGYDFARDYSLGEPLQLVYKKGKGDVTTNEYGHLVDANGKPVNADGVRIDSNGDPIVNGYNEETTYWRTKHRFTFDLTEKWKVGRLTFSLRERYLLSRNLSVDGCEYKYREELEESDLAGYAGPYIGPYVDQANDSYWYGLDRIEGKSAKTKHDLRTRLAIDYNIRRCPVTPFVSYEISNDLCDRFAIERHRVTGGIDWNFTADKRHALSLAYLYQHGAQEETGDTDLHIISVGYKFSFESALAKRQKKAAKKARQTKK